MTWAPAMILKSIALFVLAGLCEIGGGGGVFVALSLAWGWILDGHRPDRFDLLGGLLCLLGVGVIMYAPRP
jgi:drug/metabolite transporter superfamily protein YnfA